MIVSWVADSLDRRRWATYQSRRNLPRGGAKRLGSRSGRRPQLVRGTDVMRVKGLVWLGIPADDYASAVRFFTQTLGLEMAFEAPRNCPRRMTTGSRCLARATATSGSTGIAVRASCPCSR